MSQNVVFRLNREIQKLFSKIKKNNNKKKKKPRKIYNAAKISCPKVG